MTKPFKRELGLVDAFMLSVGGMIGGAIFIFPGATARLAGDASFIAWFLAGLLMMLISLLYIELSTVYPRTGGPAVYPYLVFSERPGIAGVLSYLEGMGFFLGWLIGIVVSALSLPQYMNYIVPGASSYTVPIAIISILLAFAVNLMGIRMTGKTNFYLTSLLLSLLIIFVSEALLHGDPPLLRRELAFNIRGLPPAIALAIGAYGAWVGITTIAEEVKNPHKTIPRSIILSILTVSIIYSLVVYGFQSMVDPLDYTVRKEILYSPIAYAASRIGNAYLSTLFIPLGGMTAIFTTMLVGMMSVSRVLYAMGHSRVLPGILAATLKRNGSPIAGLAAITIASLLLALFPSFFFKFIVIGLVVGTDIPYAINILSYIYYKSRLEKIAGEKPVFKAPGGIGLALISLGILAFVTAALGVQEPLWSISVLVGLLVVFLASKFLKTKILR